MQTARFSLWAFLILITSTLLAVAYDLSSRRDPQGPLGIRLDYSLAVASGGGTAQGGMGRQVVYTCHLKFKGNTESISDGQLFQMDIDAFKETEPERTQYKFGSRYKSAVMAVLAVGPDIFLASSQKGKASFTYGLQDSPVLKSLKLCQMVWHESDKPSTIHQNEGSCGEVMGAHLCYRLNPSK